MVPRMVRVGVRSRSGARRVAAARRCRRGEQALGSPRLGRPGRWWRGRCSATSVRRGPRRMSGRAGGRCRGRFGLVQGPVHGAADGSGWCEVRHRRGRVGEIGDVPGPRRLRDPRVRVGVRSCGVVPRMVRVGVRFAIAGTASARSATCRVSADAGIPKVRVGVRSCGVVPRMVRVGVRRHRRGRVGEIGDVPGQRRRRDPRVRVSVRSCGSCRGRSGAVVGAVASCRGWFLLRRARGWGLCPSRSVFHVKP